MSTSGGDIAIYAMNSIVGMLQIIAIAILIRKKENTYSKVIYFIILFQIIEITITTIWGYKLREFLIQL